MTFILLLLSLGSVAGVAGILWMLFGPTGPLFVAQSPLRVSYAGMRSGFAPVARAASDFSLEEHVHLETPVVDVAPRISSRVIAPPPPLPLPELADVTHFDASPVVVAPIPSLPKVAQAVALPSVPRLGVASASKGSHLAPRAKILPPLPSRTARGTSTPLTSGKLSPSAFSTDQVTIAHADTMMSDGDIDHTVVD